MQIKDEVTSESQSVIQNKYGTGDKDIDYAVDTVQEKVAYLSECFV